MSKTEKRCCEFVSVPGEFIPQQCFRDGTYPGLRPGEYYCERHLPVMAAAAKLDRLRGAGE